MHFCCSCLPYLLQKRFCRTMLARHGRATHLNASILRPDVSSHPPYFCLLCDSGLLLSRDVLSFGQNNCVYCLPCRSRVVEAIEHIPCDASSQIAEVTSAMVQLG